MRLFAILLCVTLAATALPPNGFSGCILAPWRELEQPFREHLSQLLLMSVPDFHAAFIGMVVRTFGTEALFVNIGHLRFRPVYGSDGFSLEISMVNASIGLQGNWLINLPIFGDRGGSFKVLASVNALTACKALMSDGSVPELDCQVQSVEFQEFYARGAWIIRHFFGDKHSPGFKIVEELWISHLSPTFHMLLLNYPKNITVFEHPIAGAMSVELDIQEFEFTDDAAIICPSFRINEKLHTTITEKPDHYLEDYMVTVGLSEGFFGDIAEMARQTNAFDTFQLVGVSTDDLQILSPKLYAKCPNCPLAVRTHVYNIDVSINDNEFVVNASGKLDIVAIRREITLKVAQANVTIALSVDVRPVEGCLALQLNPVDQSFLLMNWQNDSVITDDLPESTLYDVSDLAFRDFLLPTLNRLLNENHLQIPAKVGNIAYILKSEAQFANKYLLFGCSFIVDTVFVAKQLASLQ